jgi:hypothetical protein
MMSSLRDRLEIAPVPVVAWRYRGHRRVALPPNATASRELFKRVMRRYIGGRAQHATLLEQFAELIEPDRPLTARFRDHIVTIVRPFYAAGALDAVEPVFICQEGRGGRPRVPCLFAEVEPAREFVRTVAPAVPLVGWRRYDLEILEDAGDRLRFSKGASLRTALESEIVENFGPAGRDRQGLFLGQAA